MQIHYNYKPIEDFITALPKQHYYLITNPGNAGDAVIALGTFMLFDRMGLDYQIIDFNNLPDLNNQIVFISGGGNLIENKYYDIYNVIKKYASNNHCILLPHTIYGFKDIFEYVKSGNLDIFCRDIVSYELCSIANDLDTTHIFLDDDMAFQIKDDFFKPFTLNKGKGTGNCFRVDVESANLVKLPLYNRDISTSWIGALWHDKELAEYVVKSLLVYLSRYEVIMTDRLHVAILSTLIGRKVFFYPNSYFKNQSIFTTTLSKYPNISFINVSSELLCTKYIHKLTEQYEENINTCMPAWGGYLVPKVAQKALTSKHYQLCKVIKYAIKGKWSFSRSKRNYYRGKLQKIFTKA